MNPLAQYIDHTLLKPEATAEQIENLCQEAIEHQFYAVCVNSSRVALAHDTLIFEKPANRPRVKVAAVVGFPLGAMDTGAKAYETAVAIANGANEIDMVINIGALKDGEYATVLEDIKAVVTSASNRPVKVIIETCLLTEAEKIKACELSMEAGAAFVKTSTGFSTGGATVADVALMRKVVGTKLQVKASGGVRTAEVARAMIDAGADRIGTASGVAIVTGEAASAKGY